MKAPLNPDRESFLAFARAARAAGAKRAPFAVRIANDRWLAPAVFDEWQKRARFAFLLESAEVGEAGRYSILGADPEAVMTFAAGEATIVDREGRKSAGAGADPLAALAAFLPPKAAAPFENLPPFFGGVVGYLGYDSARHYEPVGAPKSDPIQIPETLWMRADLVAVFDHLKSEIYLICNCAVDGDVDAVFDLARARVERFFAEGFGFSPPPPPSLAAQIDLERYEPPRDLPPSNFTRAAFEEVVVAAKEHIRKGDVFQVVPSQRFEIPLAAPPFEVYRRLRRHNPSPYMFYLRCGDFTLAGSSPELMTHCAQGKARVRPIAGTRPRGRDRAEDEALARELLADEKELAEHMMLVDLGRNDIGRIARAGTVSTPPNKLKIIERYSHVMHLVSEVEGETESDDFCAAMRATYPAGTLTGAPKVRAMQIINDLESSRRGAYGGLAGYVGDFELLTCIVIRSFVAKNGRLWAQAGGGVVADSDPASEYWESVNKARAVIDAARRANAAAAAEGGR